MAKKSASKSGGSKSKAKEMSAADHRKMAGMHRAKASLHHAKADLMDAKNPLKKSTMPRGCY